MQPFEHALVIEFFVWIAVLWFAYSYMWRRTRMRSFREDIFTMRDELFDYVWKTGLPYDLPAYREMRNLFNGTIRTVAYLRGPLVLHVISRMPDKHPSVIGIIESIENQDVRRHFEAVYFKYGLRLVRYLGIHWFLLAALVEVRRRHRHPHQGYDLRVREIQKRVTRDLADELVHYGERNTPQARTVAELAGNVR